ncbi:MAG: acyl-CoA dehydrogenase family protein [Alphaproteobacteria bacterium]|nr:acyl-CoA dehydrogenase family protein [Alphaproteobacteria bacterium]
MDFDLSPERRQFVEAVRRFAERELAAGALARAHADGLPWDVAAKLAAQGLFGITVKSEDGGQGGTLLDAVLAIETVALVCPRSADLVQAGNFGAIRTFAEYASAEQKRRFLPDLLAGKAVMSVGMSEPEAGSAVTDLKTKAEPDGKGFRVNGTKVFSTNSGEAAVFLVYVRFGPGVGGIGSVLIERDRPGLRIGRPSRFMNGESWSQLYFEDCFVPAENVLLGAGGFKRQIAGFNVERLGNSARALAVGRCALNLARDHALSRIQFGRPLAEFQGLQWKFADAAMQMDGAQMLLYRAAVAADRGLPDAYQTAVAKLACNLAGFNAANEAVQVMGALGFSQESLAEYCLRRTRGWMIAGGSVEILRNRIAETVFGRSFDQRPPKPEAKGR